MSIAPSIRSPWVPAIAPATGGGVPWESSAGGSVSLEAQILALLGVGAGGGVQMLYHPLSATGYTLSGTAVTSYHDLSGLGRHATQSTGTMQPAYGATAINGRPGITFDGGDVLTTSAVNLTGFERAMLTMVFVDTNTTLYQAGGFGETTSAGCLVQRHSEANGRLAAMSRSATTSGETRSAASFLMASAGVVTATADYTLTTQATRIRHNGTDVSDSFASDADLSGSTVGNLALMIGNRAAADLGITGSIGAVVMAAWPTATAFPTAAITAVEQLLMRTWGI
jgi:hypothetical protein